VILFLLLRHSIVANEKWPGAEYSTGHLRRARCFPTALGSNEQIAAFDCSFKPSPPLQSIRSFCNLGRAGPN
jgi:hypothetical protein